MDGWQMIVTTLLLYKSILGRILEALFGASVFACVSGCFTESIWWKYTLLMIASQREPTYAFCLCWFDSNLTRQHGVAHNSTRSSHANTAPNAGTRPGTRHQRTDEFDRGRGLYYGAVPRRQVLKCKKREGHLASQSRCDPTSFASQTWFYSVRYSSAKRLW
jgi:hypothetical protein